MKLDLGLWYDVLESYSGTFPLKSYLSHLKCSNCGLHHSAEMPQSTCIQCGKMLYAQYDLDAASHAVSPSILEGRPDTMWRYFEFLPVRDPSRIVTLGEGGTPLLRIKNLGRSLGCSNLYLKDEGLNPTGSFKARGLSAAVSRAVELGLSRLVAPSAGNAGGALAAYGARAGITTHIYMPEETPVANKIECATYGATVTFVPGSIREAGQLASKETRDQGYFDLSTLKEPYRLEGKKTMGYELARANNWQSPDIIVYPTGGGTGLLGIWKAFEEMETLGWLREQKRPAMVCVQAEGCAPLVQAFQNHEEKSTPWENPHTIASGLRVPSPFADYEILKVLGVSGGTALTVTDSEMKEAGKDLGVQEGVCASPEGAATLAGLKKLLRSGTIDPESTIVLLNTGTGLKYPDFLV